jgi:hypothetical protein
MRYMVALSTIVLMAACSRSAPLHPDPISESTSAGTTQASRLPAADQGGRPLSTTMSGREEVPGPGDADGTGTATITLNPGQGQVCFELTVANIAPATAAHIHRAPVGVAGPIVVGLTPPTSGSSTGCVTADRELVKAILQNPSEYYVNVHNAEFGPGAIRGQLSK